MKNKGDERTMKTVIRKDFLAILTLIYLRDIFRTLKLSHASRKQCEIPVPFLAVFVFVFVYCYLPCKNIKANHDTSQLMIIFNYIKFVQSEHSFFFINYFSKISFQIYLMFIH